jgi:hypothetical protein
MTVCFLAALAGPVARAAWVSIVNLDTWQGGEPTAEDLAGVTLPLGGTARLGIVIELMDGTYEDTGEYVQNQISTAIPFLDVLGATTSVRLVSTRMLAVNDAGETWHTEGYATGMNHWAYDQTAAPGPLLNAYHLIAFDDRPSRPPGHTGGGNSFAGRRIILLSEIVVEPVECCDQVASVVFAPNISEYFSEDSQQLPTIFGGGGGVLNHGGHSLNARRGYMYVRNAHTQASAFEIQVTPSNSGACCLGGGVCTYAEEGPCLAQGGRFYGIGAPCATQVTAETILEPGGDVFVHAIGAELECPDSDRGVECEDRSYHIDPWISDEHDQMCQRFGVTGSPAIPAGFFGPGSAMFDSTVCLRGTPIGVTEFGDFGSADTLIYRDQDPFAACDPPSGATRSAAIRPLALSLESIEPIQVFYDSGSWDFWRVHVDLSATYDDADPSNDPPWGTLWATKSHCNGGTYTSLLPVQARFTFTKVSQPQVTRVLDTGLAGIPPVMLDARNMPLPWVATLGATLATTNPVCSAFHAGVIEAEPRTNCDCNANGILDGCETDCNGNGRPDSCDVAINPGLDCNVNGVPDVCDLAAGTSPDVDDNDVPDECQCQSPADCPVSPFCAGAMQCVNLVCRSAGSPCPNGTFCNEAAATCDECLSDANCADLLFCNGVESCVGGECVAGEQPCAAAGMVCHEGIDLCVECLTAGHCADGLYCTGVETCVMNECVSPGLPCEEGWVCDDDVDACVCDDDGDCDDGLFCNGPDRCVGGTCVSDGDPCLAGGSFCSEVLDECVECLVNSDCNDGRFCTGVETCVDGECAASGDPCTADGLVCDVVADACRCDDHGDCADDVFCNGLDSCVDGFCTHSGDPCAADGLHCVESDEACVDCLTNAHCADGLFCNGGEVCLAGECFSVGNPCTPIGFACDEAGDRCRCDDNGDCSDGLFCNGVEVCQGGNCTGGTNPCLAQGLACDEAADRCYECRTTTECNDGLTCNGFETCVAGMCVAGTDPCAQGTYCSESIGGCVECTADAHCDDGVYCNGAEWCNSGECIAGSAPCPADRCDEAADSCLGCTADEHCDDGLFCNGVETCQSQACVTGTAPCPGQPCSDVVDACVECTARIHCDDGDVCTEDTCDTFVCRHVLRTECSEEGPARPADADGDGVPDDVDECPRTLGGEVDEHGCACTQRDPDGDGISDCFDECPDTPAGALRDTAGCTAEQRDADGDGVPNALDLCPDTPRGVSIDVHGCAVGQAPLAEDPDDPPAGRGAAGGCGLLGMAPLAGMILGLRLVRRRKW